MYVPEHFAPDDPALLWEIVAAHPFATLITVADGAPQASQVPLVRRGADRLIGHVARANPQGLSLVGDALALFAGPHAYVSPSWYTAQPAVPTWNYVSVQASGPVCILDDPADVADALRILTAVFEPNDRWRFDDLPAEYVAKMARGIVAFEMTVTRLEGKLKLSQNKPAADRQRIAGALEASPDTAELAVADWMRRVG